MYPSGSLTGGLSATTVFPSSLKREIRARIPRSSMDSRYGGHLTLASSAARMGLEEEDGEEIG